MRWGCTALLIVTASRFNAVAGPEVAPPTSHDPVAASPVSDGTPWIDQAPALAFAPRPPRDWRLASAVSLASLYAGFSAWAYLAQYRNQPEKDLRDFGRDGWLGVKTYAGGVDKLCHAWATMVLSRGGAALLRAGG